MVSPEKKSFWRSTEGGKWESSGGKESQWKFLPPFLKTEMFVSGTAWLDTSHGVGIEQNEVKLTES